jgi:hypothetical protein
MGNKYVRMRAPGEARGLEQRTHGVRGWIFRAGVWEIKKLDAEEAEFLKRYRNPRGVRLFDVCDSEAEALRVVADRKREMAAASLTVTPSAMRGQVGIAGTDDDLVAIATAEMTATRAAPRRPTPEESLAAEAEALAMAAEAAAAMTNQDDESQKTDSEQKSHGELMALLVSTIGHDLARAAIEKFGDDLPEIIVRNPGKLASVAGIGRRSVAKVKRAVERADWQ